MPMDFSLLALLAVLFTLTFIGNGLIPLPITAYVLWLGQFHAPIPVILTATLGTVLGAWVMEPVFRKACQQRLKLHRVIPSYYHRFFQERPDLCVLLFNVLPFPWDPSRVLAHLHAYPPQRLAMVLAVGRLGRYTLLVFLGAWLAHYQLIFISVLLALGLVPLLVGALTWLKTLLS